MLCVLLGAVLWAKIDVDFPTPTDVYDSLEVIERFPAPPRAKDIREGYVLHETFPDARLLDKLYPSVLNPKVVDQGLENSFVKEYNFAVEKCQKNDVPESDVYWHFAGAAQYGGRTEELEKVDRVKVRYTLDSRFAYHHCSGIYMCPGEVVTVEVPQIAGGKVKAQYNRQVFSYRHGGNDTDSGGQTRLPDYHSGEIVLKSGMNRLAWPYGGFLSFGVSIDAFSEPIELIISGGVLTPWFRFGVDTEADWERIKKYPGLVACFETGNLQMIMPASEVRQATGINLAMRFFRSCAQVMESVSSKPCGAGPRANGRERVPNFWYFDVYVVHKVAAMAYVGLNFVQMPTMWAASTALGESLVRSGCWGLLHELGHHHQQNWGAGDRKANVEVTNNALIVLCYTYYSLVSESRYEQGNGGIGFSSGTWQDHIYSHPYGCTFSKGWLEQYVSLIHAFGQAKMREFIRSDVQNLYYDKSKGTYVAYAIRAAHVLGVDLRPHLRFHGVDFDQQPNKDDLKKIDELHVKPWYPVCNIYQTGYEVNGQVFETSRPWILKYGEKKIFDFKQYTKSREGHGTFSIGDLRGGRGTWKLVREGVYEYTPPRENPSEPDEWRLTYHESETNQDIITYGRIRQEVNGNAFSRFSNIRASSGTYTPLEAYKATKGVTASATGYGTGISIDTTNGDNFVSVCRGTFVAPQSGNYTFYADMDDAALFYLSERQLSFDPDIDRKYLLLNDNNGHHTYNKQYASDWHILTKGKAYSFCFVIYNHGGSGRGKIGYVVDGKGDIVDVPSANVLLPGCKAEHLEEVWEWSPNWEEPSGLHDYYKAKRLAPEVVSVTGPQPQSSDNPVTNLVNSNTNDIFISKWQPGSEAAPFPHVYTLSFGTETQIRTVKLNNLTKQGFTTYYVVGPLDIFCDDRVVYHGHYDSREKSNATITLSEPATCRSVKVQVGDNSDIWSTKNQGKGGSAFSEISCGVYFNADTVIPVSDGSFVFDSLWEDVSVGSYFDGRGKVGRSGGSVSCVYGKGTSELVIIGDKWYSGSSSGSQTLSANRASVYVDGKLVGTFSPDLSNKPAFGSRLYKSPLFVISDLDKNSQHTLKIVVDSGEIALSGVLVKSSEKAAALNPT